MVWQIFEGELGQADVRDLLAQHFAEMRAGSPPEACHVLPIDGLKHPAIRFFTLREDGALLGCGALKQLDPGHGEIKSMRTADAALGRGVGRAMRSVFDPQDAFFLPIFGLSGIPRPGPDVFIYRRASARDGR
jgi:hypothetical protein